MYVSDEAPLHSSGTDHHLLFGAKIDADEVARYESIIKVSAADDKRSIGSSAHSSHCFSFGAKVDINAKKKHLTTDRNGES